MSVMRFLQNILCLLFVPFFSVGANAPSSIWMRKQYAVTADLGVGARISLMGVIRPSAQ
jgi:hypothetical protein